MMRQDCLRSHPRRRSEYYEEVGEKLYFGISLIAFFAFGRRRRVIGLHDL